MVKTAKIRLDFKLKVTKMIKVKSLLLVQVKKLLLRIRRWSKRLRSVLKTHWNSLRMQDLNS